MNQKSSLREGLQFVSQVLTANTQLPNATPLQPAEAQRAPIKEELLTERAIIESGIELKSGIPGLLIPGCHIARLGWGAVYFREKPEAGNSIGLTLLPDPSLPVVTLEQILHEIQASRLSDRERVVEGFSKIAGHNPSVRAKVLRISPFTDRGDLAYQLELGVARHSFSYSALRAVRDIPNGVSPTYDALYGDKLLSSLGVEIALVSASHARVEGRVDANREIALQRRSNKPLTFNLAWDVSAAGYIEYLPHQSPEAIGSVSICSAAGAELTEEIAVPKLMLPNEEYYEFFGLVYLPSSAYLDVVGQCTISHDAFKQWYGSLSGEKLSPYISEVRAISLTPNGIRDFLGEQHSNRYWNPTGFIGVIGALRRAGFRENEIWGALESAIPTLIFDPHYRPDT